MNSDYLKYDFLRQNSPDGGFLQSSQWLKFQEKVGRKTIEFQAENFAANLIEQKLPIVGAYFYCPRGPIFEVKSPKVQKSKSKLWDLVKFAKEKNAGWIRIEPATEDALAFIKENIREKIVKAPHDTQPKEIFVLDISKTEEQLLGEMKSKARYNINLAKKKGVKISCHSEFISESVDEEEMLKHESHAASHGVQHDSAYIEAFLKLSKEMAQRQGIVTHPDEYYHKMIQVLPEEMLKIYVAEYEDEIIAANLVLFYGEFATYLHGASSNSHRNVMAPFLLQWQAILDAKAQGCKAYDFGGVKITDHKQQTTNNWEGITNFKLGFSPNTKPIVFPGSYDIIINPRKYAVYRGLQRAKHLIKNIKK